MSRTQRRTSAPTARAAGSTALVLALSWNLAACRGESGTAVPQDTEIAPPPARAAGSQEEGLRLGVPPRQIHRARREAEGLVRVTPRLRAQLLQSRRDRRPSLPYGALRADPDAHAHESVSFEGMVGLVRSAGPRLWIMALHTRRDGNAWRDPLYVLSVVPPGVPPDGGATARVDGWVVGERTIGRHPLPLMVAYHVERTGEPPDPSERSSERSRLP